MDEGRHLDFSERVQKTVGSPVGTEVGVGRCEADPMPHAVLQRICLLSFH